MWIMFMFPHPYIQHLPRGPGRFDCSGCDPSVDVKHRHGLCYSVEHGTNWCFKMCFFMIFSYFLSILCMESAWKLQFKVYINDTIDALKEELTERPWFWVYFLFAWSVIGEYQHEASNSKEKKLDLTTRNCFRTQKELFLIDHQHSTHCPCQNNYYERCMNAQWVFFEHS